MTDESQDYEEHPIASEGWLVKVNTVIPGAAPITQIFIVGLGTQEEAESQVRQYSGIEPTAKISAVRRLVGAELWGESLHVGEVKQYD